MDFEKNHLPAQPVPRRQEPERAEGCLTAAIRIPVRIVVLVLFVPVRMVWDLLTFCAKATGRALASVGQVLLVIPALWLYEWGIVPVAKGLGYLVYGVLILPWVVLWKYVLVPVVRYGIVMPAVWLYRRVLMPLGHGAAWLARGFASGIAAAARAVGAAVAWLVMTLLVAPVVWVYARVLTPVGHGIAWLARGFGYGVGVAARAVATAVVWVVATLLVKPVVWVVVNVLVKPAAWLFVTLVVKPVVWFWRAVLTPVGREIAAAAGHGWRIAGYISRAVGRVLKWLGRNLLGRPVRWVWLSVCTPVGHWLRDAVWAPAKRAAVEAGRSARAAVRAARETVRQARQDAWRALVGGARGEVRAAPEPAVAEAREPLVSPARTLGSRTIAPSAAPAPEISLLGESTAKQG
ncbi:hypothetical protein [Streptomyces sp. H27-C3]|uniref:hypothetical protein n=1 Tax=Streptomyces sp. H27-C3 TaxID=3046305 RepID=UPI0024BA6212|nr:hypothetical protein [Streptomyces sp. H27-C3]MDJ0463550.1 hypothetical protein [Streptomyces sp. H27-C3]